MIPRQALASSVVVLVLVSACGGSKRPAKAPASGDEASGSSDGTDSTSSAWSGASTEAAPAPSATETQGPVTCTANGVCTEIPATGKEASDAKDRCKTAGGDPRDGVCNHEDVAATCTIASKNVSMYFYDNKNMSKEMMRGFLKGGEDACTEATGTYKRTPPKKGGGRGKPKAAKKKK